MRGLTLHTRFRRRIAGMRTRRALPRHGKPACSTAAGAAVAAHGMEPSGRGRAGGEEKQSAELAAYSKVSERVERAKQVFSDIRQAEQDVRKAAHDVQTAQRAETAAQQAVEQFEAQELAWKQQEAALADADAALERWRAATTRRACWRTIWQPLCACRMKSRS